MAIIKTQTMENATGKVKEIYEEFLKVMPMIPKPIQLMSASPDLLVINSYEKKYFLSHPNLSPLLQAYIRMLAAFNSDYPYCVDFNTNVLKMLGNLTDEHIAAVRINPAEAQLTDKDKAMLEFVIKAVSAPEEIEAQDVAMLHQAGWNDPDIFDAASLGIGMVAMGMLFNIFKMYED